MTYLYAITLVMFVLCFGTFWWGTTRYFVRDGGEIPGGMKLISRASELFTVVQILSYYRAEPTRWTGVGFALYCLSLTVYVTAVGVHWRRPPTLAYSQDTPQHLVRLGPYRFIRHPFYTAYNLAWLAAWPITGQWWHLGIAAMMALLYDRSARLEEAKFSRSTLAREYEAYRASTGRYLPNLLKILRN